jgi:hypothetical protein
VEWKAYVDGERFDLDIAKELYPEDGKGFVRFGEDATGVYFRSEELEAAPDPSAPEVVSASLLVRINACGRLVDPSFRPLRLTKRFLDVEGNQTIVLGTAVLEGRGRFTATGVVASSEGAPATPSPPLAPQLVNLADRDTIAAEVMRIMGTHSALGWAELYKVFEIVEHELGGRNALVATGWTTRRMANNFTMSANRRDVSGDGARHARNAGGKPSADRSMTLTDGTDYIRDLTRSWLVSRL